MKLLDDATWAAKICVNGWVDGSGQDIVAEPTTVRLWVASGSGCVGVAPLRGERRLRVISGRLAYECQGPPGSGRTVRLAARSASIPKAVSRRWGRSSRRALSALPRLACMETFSAATTAPFVS